MFFSAFTGAQAASWTESVRQASRRMAYPIRFFTTIFPFFHGVNWFDEETLCLTVIPPSHSNIKGFIGAHWSFHAFMTSSSIIVGGMFARKAALSSVSAFNSTKGTIR